MPGALGCTARIWRDRTAPSQRAWEAPELTVDLWSLRLAFHTHEFSRWRVQQRERLSAPFVAAWMVRCQSP